MSLQTKDAGKDKLNTFWREILLSDDGLMTQPSPRHEELRHRASETCLSQEATDGYDPEDRPQAERDLRRAKGNRA